jgi:hypothetical protein
MGYWGVGGRLNIPFSPQRGCWSSLRYVSEDEAEKNANIRIGMK